MNGASIDTLRICLKNGLLVAQATRLFRPATCRKGSNGSRQWGPPYRKVFRDSSGRRVASCLRRAKRLGRFCLSLPSRHERGESRREGKLIKGTSSPRPSPPFEEERERKSGCALKANVLPNITGGPPAPPIFKTSSVSNLGFIVGAWGLEFLWSLALGIWSFQTVRFSLPLAHV